MRSPRHLVERGVALVLVGWSLLVMLTMARYQRVLDGLHPPPPIKGTSLGTSRLREETRGPVYQGNEPLSLVRRLFEVGEKDRRRLVEELAADPLGVLGEPARFRCPAALEERLDFPDLVSHSRAEAFRRGEAGTWVFYQHLRKAGGTSFCDLARRNLKSREVPPYYCMPDERG